MFTAFLLDKIPWLSVSVFMVWKQDILTNKTHRLVLEYGSW